MRSQVSHWKKIISSITLQVKLLSYFGAKKDIHIIYPRRVFINSERIQRKISKVILKSLHTFNKVSKSQKILLCNEGVQNSIVKIQVIYLKIPACITDFEIQVFCYISGNNFVNM